MFILLRIKDDSYLSLPVSTRNSSSPFAASHWSQRRKNRRKKIILIGSQFEQVYPFAASLSSTSAMSQLPAIRIIFKVCL